MASSATANPPCNCTVGSPRSGETRGTALGIAYYADVCTECDLIMEISVDVAPLNASQTEWSEMFSAVHADIFGDE